MSEVKSYKRRLRNGKVIQVKSHSRKGGKSSNKEPLSYEYLKKYEDSLQRLSPSARASREKKLAAMWKEFHAKNTENLFGGSRMLRSEGLTKR